MPGYNDAFMSSLNDHNAWAGNIEDVIAMPIQDSGRPLIDMTHDDKEISLSGAVKEELADEPADPRGKHDVVHDQDYNFFQYYDHHGRRRHYFMFKASWISFKSL
jgi:hypothetical protein